MGFFSRLAQKAASSMEARLDAMHQMVLDLPEGTVWAASAEWEKRFHDDETTGLLSHDGEFVTFRAWREDFVFTIPVSAITHRRGEAKVDDGRLKGELDDVRPLRLVLPGYDLPAFATIDEGDRPMMGFFASSGIPV